MKLDKKHYIGGGVLVFIIILALFFSRKKKAPVANSPVANSPVVKEPATEVQKDLASIKDRIKGIEKYREYYRSEDNNGLTIGGTIMEQMIDIIIAILKQKEVSALMKKFIQRKEDAIAIAELIETLGGEFSKLLSTTKVLDEVVEGKQYRVNNNNVLTLSKQMDEKLANVLSSNKQKYYNLAVGIVKDNDEVKDRPVPPIEVVDSFINNIKERGFFGQMGSGSKKGKKGNDTPRPQPSTAPNSVSGVASGTSVGVHMNAQQAPLTANSSLNTQPQVLNSYQVPLTANSSLNTQPRVLNSYQVSYPATGPTPPSVSGVEGYTIR